MGSFNSKLTVEERLRLETAAKEKHIVLIVNSLEQGDPICTKFIDLLQPLCRQLSVLGWTGKQLKPGNGLDTIQSAHKIILVHVRADGNKPFTVLAGDTMFAGLHSYLQHNNFDISNYGRLVCCYISNNGQVHDYHHTPCRSDIWTTLIKRGDHLVTAISVNIPFTRRWCSFEEPEAAVEHILMALEMPLTETATTIEPLRKILVKRVDITE
jgi:hypothetical protein